MRSGGEHCHPELAVEASGEHFHAELVVEVRRGTLRTLPTRKDLWEIVLPSFKKVFPKYKQTNKIDQLKSFSYVAPCV